MAAVRLEFAQFGHFDYFKIYRNLASTNIEDLGQPIGTSSTMYYEDSTVEPSLSYFYRIGVVRGGVEKISNEYLVETTVSLWNSTSVVMLHISDAANTYHTFEGSSTRSSMGASLSGSYKWAGGVLAPNGKIYCVPRNAEDILIIDPATNTATRSTMGASSTGSNKWSGGVLAPNGKIYSIPLNAADILIIDPATDTATRSNMGASLSGSYKWVGGVLAPNGKIYCTPFLTSDILIIDPSTNTATRSTLGASLTGSEEWFGGVLAPNGKIYYAPLNATDILIIDKNPSVPALGKKDCLSPHLNKF